MRSGLKDGLTAFLVGGGTLAALFWPAPEVPDPLGKVPVADCLAALPWSAAGGGGVGGKIGVGTNFFLGGGLGGGLVGCSTEVDLTLPGAASTSCAQPLGGI